MGGRRCSFSMDKYVVELVIVFKLKRTKSYSDSGVREGG